MTIIQWFGLGREGDVFSEISFFPNGFILGRGVLGGGGEKHLSYCPINVVNQIMNLGKTCFDGIWPYNLCKNYIVRPPDECVTENYFSYFSTKTYVVGTQKNGLNKTVLLSTQNICLN